MFARIKHYSAWALAGILGLSAGTSIAGAAEEKVELDKVPPFIRHQIESATKGATHVEVVKITTEGRPDEEYIVKYAEQGKERTLRLDPTGRVLAQGDARSSQHSEEQAQLAKAKTEQDKARIEEQVGSRREKEDREQFEAFKAAEAKEAVVHPEHAERKFAGIKEMSEEYNSKDMHRIPASELPPGVRKAFDSETIGTTDVDYYRYTVDGKQFYSAHYNTGAGRRIVCRVDQYGKLLGKNELTTASSAPAVEEHAVSVVFDQLPRNIQETMRRETQGSKDLAYYKITRGGAVFYTVHYTTPDRGRFDLWLDPEGQVVSHLLCVLQPGDRNYMRDELGR